MSEIGKDKVVVNLVLPRYLKSWNIEITRKPLSHMLREIIRDADITKAREDRLEPYAFSLLGEEDVECYQRLREMTMLMGRNGVSNYLRSELHKGLMESMVRIVAELIEKEKQKLPEGAERILEI